MDIKRIQLLGAFAGLLLLCGFGEAAAQSTIKCESTDGQYRACAVNTTGGVTLSRQLSSQGCWKNDTWGYDRNRIWVNRGCRAEFRIGNSSGSSNDNTGAKVAGALVLGAIVAAVISNQNNDRNDYRDNRNGYYDNSYNNNGYNNGGYNNGGYNNGGGYYGNGSQQAREIRCESKSGRYTRCGNVNPRARVEIRRQLSNTSCVYGRSWGVDGRQLWVDDGCRAVFVTY